MSAPKRYCIFLLIILIPLFSCKYKKREYVDNEGVDLEEPLIRANKYLVKKDKETIESYYKRRNWDMKMTRTGLYYMIYETGNGIKAKAGKVSTIRYTVSLLDGTLCYSSDSLGLKKFKIGAAGIEPGLNEGILLLGEGDKARFIMAPYLAFGLLGDLERIPPRSIILYDIELIEISDN